jgi:tetratricopeptide (TPR) repeat protein
LKIIYFTAAALSIIFLFLINVSEAEANPEEALFMANQAYKEGLFQDAVTGYKKLIESGYGNGHVYFNLGNSYFRLEQLGLAILNYERARLLIPRDADLNFNLRYARDHIQDAVTEEQGFLDMVFFWTDSLTIREVFWGFAILNILFWGILFIRLFTRMEWSFYATVIILIFWLITGVSFGWKYISEKTNDRAVILNKEVDVLAGPDQGDTVLFKLHEGTIVRHERSEDEWSLVSFSEGKRGWLKSKGIGPIRETLF